MPFFVYFNHSMMHMPVIPRLEFKGKTRQGDWADSLLELDTDFGALLDLLDELDIADNTLVVSAGDYGPEEVLLWCAGRRYRCRAGHPLVAAVLGAGNVAAITPLDILHKL